MVVGARVWFNARVSPSSPVTRSELPVSRDGGEGQKNRPSGVLTPPGTPRNLAGYDPHWVPGCLPQLHEERFDHVDNVFFYSTSKPVFDSNPAQRVVMLYAVPRTTKRVAPFPIEIPPPSAAYPLVFEPANAIDEPSYGSAVQSFGKPVLQYTFVGQWVQRFPLSQPYGMIRGKTGNQGVWIDVLPPFDGLGETKFYGFRVYNDSAGDIKMRFGPGALPFGEAIAAGSYGKYGAIGGVDAAETFTITPTNRLQLRAAGANANYRIEFWLAPNGKGGCGCGK